MSIVNPIEEILKSELLPVEDIGNTHLDGIYFKNLNRDRAVRIIASRPNNLFDNEHLENNNRTIENLDQNSVGFCLSPRPTLNITCDGATSDVAVKLTGGKRYKVVIDGQTISTGATPAEMLQLLQPYSIELNYLRLPQEFYCAEYNTIDHLYIPLTVLREGTIRLNFTPKTRTATAFSLEFTTTSTLVNSSEFGNFFIESYTLSDNTAIRIMMLSLTPLASVASEWKVECVTNLNDLIPMDLRTLLSSSIDPNIATTPRHYPTIHNSNAYWCVNPVAGV